VRVIRSGGEDIPTDPSRNTASVGVVAMIEERAPDFGIELEIEKGIPLGSGIGGSAASAVAGVVAANALFDAPLSDGELLRYAMLGEAAASGAMHADNVAPSLLGGLVLIRSADGQDLVRLPVPDSLRSVVALPKLRIDTRGARAVLPPSFPMNLIVEQSANLAGFIAGLFTGDLALVSRSMRDVLAEPYRAALIPGFHDVQSAAIEAGALACTISGAGPALLAWCDGDEVGARIGAAMVAAFEQNGLPSTSWTSRVDEPGARIEEAA
jgi:homoserine kinase